MIRIRLFGEVSATGAGGRPLDVGPPKCQSVLAVLALSIRYAVPVSRIAEVVWAENPPRTAEKTLQSYVARLRKGLGPDAIVRTGAAYRLDLPAEAVDVARFRQHLGSGDTGAALAEWTGTPLGGLEVPGLTATVDSLVEQWLGAMESSLERLVETDPAAAIGPLTELTANHPFREGLWALLMAALYRVGRQADALAAFHRVRTHLVDQLGVDPGPRLRVLEQLILEHSETLGSGTGPTAGYAGPSSRPTGTVTFGYCLVEGRGESGVAHRAETTTAMARLDVLVRAVAQRHGGQVFVAAGESFGAAFHRAEDAIAWSAALHAAASIEPWAGGVHVRLRVGLHTGAADERATGYFGPAVNTASGLAAAAHGGQSLLSTVTGALLDRTDLRSLGIYRLDNVVAEHEILQLGHDEYPPLRTQQSRRGNLTPPRDRLIGRDEELEAVADALGASPVVTLVGPGGIGKTRLALAAGHRSEGDRSQTWFVDLTQIAGSADVPRAVADTLGIPEQPGRSLTESVVLHLHGRDALVVMDNCEHVIVGAAELAQAITQGCPHVRVLATSRERLGCSGEQLIAVPALDPAGPGTELFVQRALAVSRTFQPQGNQDAIQEICRRLDGIPLAIELAAARTGTLTPAEMAERLGDRLQLLGRGRRTGAERHRTMRATIQWSYDLLQPPHQVTMPRLSVFAGPFDLVAAESVLEGVQLDGAAVEDLLEDLVERSMLVVEPGPFSRLFRLLETVREFGAEQLSAAGTGELTVARHAQWCLEQVAGIHRLLVGSGEIEGVARLAQLWPNLRAAFERACAAGDAGLADGLVRPVAGEVTLRRHSEIGDWAERILAIAPPNEERLVIFWLTWAAHRYMHSGDRGRYEALIGRYGHAEHPLIRYTHAYLYEESEALAAHSPEAVLELRRTGEDHLAALVELAGVASGLMSTGRFAEFDAFVSARADRYRGQGPPSMLHLTLVGLGYSALFQGKGNEADRHFDELSRVELPERTFTVDRPLEARAAFQRGDRARAFEILHAHLDDLLDGDVTDVARLACVEFINMMAATDHLSEAARVLRYLDTTGGFGALASSTLVAEATGKVRDTSDDEISGTHLDGHGALVYMRDVLSQVYRDEYSTAG